AARWRQDVVAFSNRHTSRWNHEPAPGAADIRSPPSAERAEPLFRRAPARRPLPACAAVGAGWVHSQGAWPRSVRHHPQHPRAVPGDLEHGLRGFRATVALFRAWRRAGRTDLADRAARTGAAWTLTPAPPFGLPMPACSR